MLHYPFEYIEFTRSKNLVYIIVVKMQSTKQKVSDMTSAAKEKIQTAKAKVEQQAATATARTEEEKEIAKEVRKVKEAEAKADLHADKARHAADKLEAKHAGIRVPATGTTAERPHHHLAPTATPTQPQTFEGAGNIPPTTAYPIPHHKRP